MKFELLPNEIFLQCFEYLNAPDIFHSFKRLNNRFDKLIRNCLLHLNFQHVRKNTFDYFCRILLFNPEIKQQILSITLSNQTDTCCQIQAFLSFFSFPEFSRLRSLSLIGVKENEVAKIQSMLSSLLNLRDFCLIGTSDIGTKLLTSLPMVRIRQLVIPTLCSNIMSIHQTTSITNLTMVSCTSLKILYELLRWIPNVEYLNIERLSNDSNIEFDNSILSDTPLLYLTTLILKTHLIVFDQLEILLKHTPNLKNLNLSTSTSKQFIDAYRWERLISVSLQQLKSFKFHFLVIFEDRIEPTWTVMEALDKFQQFQNDFWRKRHRWYTAYEFEKDFAIIFTVPYMLHEYKLTMYTNRFGNTFRRNLHCFDSVMDLELLRGTLRKGFHHYFSNVKSLKLDSAFYLGDMFDDSLRENQDIEALKMLVNLSKLKHLDIGTTCQMESSLLLLKILKQAPELSSLRINASALISAFSNDELCMYFKKMIRKLDVVKNNDHFNMTSSKIEEFCRIFSNIEQLQFPIQRADDLFFLLNQLSKLTSITVHCLFFPFDATVWVQDISMRLKKNFLFEYVQNDHDVLRPILNIWIDTMMS